ncbi:NAD-dependent epimerase/dehydratase family protein [Paenibacillus spiritus]|uniref:NAD-dependent epimerase/dehydratase family protein n=1 Tax=Paenibacillus spiritus TaxID=2496557 RepID=A0A5J5FVU9_9BACL|nr:polysaccharide biosynthesis protein [Paenibacillus spiritus]KAA8997918.1 NAD-dependent epimerase/dehydratase family protein [Paenibacillus spiritus]
MFRGSTILITGGTGSWGQKLAAALLERQPAEIRIYSRGESAQVAMNRAFGGDPRLKFIIGDVRDAQAVLDACRGVHYVFHLAALKHVPVCEFQPQETLKTNVLGTENVIRAAIDCGVRKVIDVSTDKAVDPVNVYGMTKAIGEKLTIRANGWSPGTRFVCIRGGNVLGTSGSVVPLFLRQIAEGKELTLTDAGMTRFFLTLTEAIGLLLKAAEASVGGETFVMRMNGCRIADLAAVLAEASAGDGAAGLPVRETGIRPGEKLHEVLISPYEAPSARIYDSRYFVILPPSPGEALTAAYGGLPKAGFPQYRSDDRLMNRSEIAALLRAEGFIRQARR